MKPIHTVHSQQFKFVPESAAHDFRRREEAVDRKEEIVRKLMSAVKAREAESRRTEEQLIEREFCVSNRNRLTEDKPIEESKEGVEEAEAKMLEVEDIEKEGEVVRVPPLAMKEVENEEEGAWSVWKDRKERRKGKKQQTTNGKDREE
jgi:hypothetical protein